MSRQEDGQLFFNAPDGRRVLSELRVRIDESPINSILYQLSYGDYVLTNEVEIAGVEINTGKRLTIYGVLASGNLDFKIVFKGSNTFDLVTDTATNLSSILFVGYGNPKLRISDMPQLRHLSLGGSLTLDAQTIPRTPHTYVGFQNGSEIAVLIGPTWSRHFIFHLSNPARLRVNDITVESVAVPNGSLNFHTELINQTSIWYRTGTGHNVQLNRTRATTGNAALRILSSNEIKLTDVIVGGAVNGWNGLVIFNQRSEINAMYGFRAVIEPFE